MRFLAFFAVLLPSVVVVSAQPNARDVTVARQEFRSGIAAARAGNWQEAHDHFARSYELNARPSALLNLAGAQAQTGRLVESAESYREFLGQVEEGDRNRAAAQQQLSEVQPRIPSVTIRVTNLADGDEVRLDTDILNPRLLEGAIPVNPGERTVVVTRDGQEIGRTSAEVSEGESAEVAVEVPVRAEEPVEPDPPPDPIETNPDPNPNLIVPVDPVPPEDDSSVFEHWWFWTIVGAVAIGAGIGIYFAIPPTEPPGNRGFSGPPLEVP